jgi:tripartite-type tricarboxylate transporter receptor subunit TctC
MKRKKKRMIKRIFSTVLMTVSLFAVAGLPLQAADYPTQNIRIVVPYPPGGPTDIAARLMAAVFERALGRTVVIENKSGAGGTIGAQEVARAAPDGHTLLVNASAHVISPAITRDMKYDVIKDFTPVTQLVSVPLMLLINPSVPARDVRELIAYAKANPGKLSFASSSRGSAPHFAGELFKQLAGIDIVHVPYRGAAPALTDLMSGQVQIMFDSMSSAAGHVQSGALRALAISTPERSGLLPELPTMKEAGVPDFVITNWYGLWAPKNTPPDVVNKLVEALNAGFKSPLITERLRAIGAEPVISPADDFASFCIREKEFWQKIATAANVEKE